MMRLLADSACSCQLALPGQQEHPGSKLAQRLMVLGAQVVGGHVVRSLWNPARLGGICKAVDDGLLIGLKIVSGGHTGADRAALDWASEHDIPPGGWCPKRRRAEDGPIDGRYQLKETPSVN
jgi:hypothetical protein